MCQFGLNPDRGIWARPFLLWYVVCVCFSDTSSVGVRAVRSTATCPTSPFSPFVLVESDVDRRSFRSLPLVRSLSLLILVALLARCRGVWPSRCCACGRAISVAPLRVVIVIRADRFRSPVVSRYVSIIVVTSCCFSLRVDRLHYVSLRAAARCRGVTKELWR